MQHLPVSTLYCISRLNLKRSITPICIQLRWRKPKWLPTAKSKFFRISEHPHVPPDERQLMNDLLEEYYRKTESLRKLFQEELKQNSNNEKSTFELQQKEEEEFRILLEENKKENERIRAIKEETLEKDFQENQLQLLQLEEEQKKEVEKTKIKCEEIVRMEKEKSLKYITEDNLDAAIEQAIDSPVNICFSLSLDGTIKWEGKPPSTYETDIQKRVSKGRQN